MEDLVRNILSRSFENILPFFVWVIDDKGELIFVNETWKQKTGIDISKAANLGWTKTIHPKDLKHVTYDIDDSTEHLIQKSGEIRFTCDHGSYVWYSYELIPIEYNSEHYCVGIFFKNEKHADVAPLVVKGFSNTEKMASMVERAKRIGQMIESR